MALPWGRSLTVEDVDALPDDGHRYELLDGTLLVTPAPATVHQRIVLRLAALLLAAKGPEHDVLPAPTDWVVSPSTKFQPDVIVANRAEVGELRLERPPLLAVEVQSPSTRLVDLNLKRAAYERAGVPAYWLVDPIGPTLASLRLNDRGVYEQEAEAAGDEPFDATFPFDVRIVPSQLVV